MSSSNSVFSSQYFLYFVCSLGGSFGSLLRHFLSISIFPSAFALLTANLFGSFLIGIFSHRISVNFHRSSDGLFSSISLKSFFQVGFLGGLTSFSGLAFDSAVRFQTDGAALAASNLIAETFVGLSLFFIGIRISQFFLDYSNSKEKKEISQ